MKFLAIIAFVLSQCKNVSLKVLVEEKVVVVRLTKAWLNAYSVNN